MSRYNTFCFCWNILCLGFHLISGKLILRANSDYILSFKPLTLNCSTDAVPINELVTFYVDTVIFSRIKYFTSTTKCFIERFENGQSIGGGECNNECDCQRGTSYIWSYNGTVNTNPMTFTCIGGFSSRAENDSVVVYQAEYPSSISPKRTTFYVNETGRTEQIKCAAFCIPKCTYTWSTPKGVVQNSVLYIQNIFRNHTGNYTCKAWNILGELNTTIEIFVHYRPSIEIIPNKHPYYVKENDKDILISCVVIDAYPNSAIGYRFISPNGAITESKNYTFSRIEKKHNGTYTCTARNAAGESDNASLAVNVLYGPVIVEMYNVNITENTSFIRFCNVTANPFPVRVWWTRSKEPHYSVEGKQLEIRNITRQLSDIFTCNAQNLLVPSFGGSTSINNNGSFALNVQYGPEIKELQNVNVTELSDFSATCNVMANPQPFRVWWTRAKQVDFLVEGLVLNLNQIQKTKSDLYVCHAENMLHPTFGSIIKKNASRQFYINVQYGPQISIIGNVDVLENTPFNKTCNVSSNPLAHHVWWTRSDNAEVIDGPDLMFSAITRTYTDNYTCHAENIIFPSDSNVAINMLDNTTFYINVQYGPGNRIHIIPSIFNLNVTEKEDIINITCQADCNPTCSYEWSKLTSPTIIESAHLIDSEVDRVDAGNYTCSAKSKISQNISTISVEINVLYAARIFKISPTTTVNESFRFILECKVDSFPLSTITWILNRTNEEVFKESGVRISRYSVEKASCNQTGTYACSAYSGILPRASQQTELRILCSPRSNIKYPSSNPLISIGDKEPLNITVHFISYPKPKSLRWIFYKNSSTEVVEKISNCYSYGLYEHQACFLNSNVTEADFGIYKLQVKYTELVIWEKEFAVEGNRKPMSPSYIHVVCKSTTAVVIFKPTLIGNLPQELYIQYAVEGQNVSVIQIHMNDTKQPIEYTVTKLNPGRNYNFSILVVNLFGETRSKQVQCLTDTLSIGEDVLALKEDNSSMFSAGIASLVIGILFFVAATTFIFRKRFQKTYTKSSKSDEYSDLQTSNPAYQDPYTSIQNPSESRHHQETSAYAYEECGNASGAATYQNMENMNSGQKKADKNMGIYDNMKI